MLKLNLRAKLTLLILIPVMALALIAVVDHQSKTAVEAAFFELTQVNAPVTTALEEIKVAGSRLISSTNELALNSLLPQDEAEEVEDEAGQITDAINRYTEALAAYESLILTFEQDDIAIYNAIQAAGQTVLDVSASVISLLDTEASLAIIGEARAAFEGAEVTFFNVLDAQLEHEREEREISQHTVVISTENANRFTIVAAMVLVMVGSWVIYFTISSILRPILNLTVVAQAMSEGDYSQRSTLQGRDEIGKLGQIFNRMANTIQERETSLIDLNQSLEKRVEERTAELTSQAESLRVATARAKEAARIKGEFLANVSHELRTPLNAIIGFADMLLMGMSGTLNEKQQHKLLRLKENGVRLLTLINNILDLTRIEARRIEVVSKPFSPFSLTGQITSQMTVLADQRSLNFAAFVEPDVPPALMGDVQRIEQIMVNLLSNAFKFTDTGLVNLNVFADIPANIWGFAVSDTGIGIPPHAVELIFEEFRQVDGSSSRAFKGSGLGLAITRNLVAIMDGHIAVESEPGKGSTFMVTLPLEVAQSVPASVLEKAGM